MVGLLRPCHAIRRAEALCGAAREAGEYGYLHLLKVAGIIFVALGVEQTLAHVGESLGKIAAVALCAGVVLYLLGHNAFKLRGVGA